MPTCIDEAEDIQHLYMLTLTSAQEMLDFTDKQRSKSVKIGFIPTMGALHDGHITLIEASKKENDLTVCSIFVNPTQFNEAADFNKYPRQIAADLDKLKHADCDVVFTPELIDIYPEPDTNIYDLGFIGETIEAAHRPGHFNGVASVVKRLLELVKPHNAYFGLKDYQQYLVIKKLAEQYHLNVTIVGCPIKREESGLAMSSRNQLLSQAGEETAINLYRSLNLVRNVAHQYPADELEKIGLAYLQSKEGITPEYFVVVNKNTLKPSENNSASELIALVAARVDGVRLIDNMFL